MENILKVVLFAAVVWAFVLLTRYLEKHWISWTRGTAGKVDDILLPYLARSARFLVPAIAVILALPLMDIPDRHEGVVRKATGIVIIGIVAWMLWKTVNVGEAIILRYYVNDPKDDLRARTVLTQVQVIRKVLLVLIAVFSAASTLMLFDEVRELGSNILASAGVLGVIIGFAAQRTIANLFAGFQIAITQPIRLGDSVRVEGEFGSIEEITLTYVVIKTWDWKRLILPINHFIEKPFQNWKSLHREAIPKLDENQWCDHGDGLHLSGLHRSPGLDSAGIYADRPSLLPLGQKRRSDARHRNHGSHRAGASAHELQHVRDEFRTAL